MPSTFSKRILFRVEGNDVVGHGHFMRCLTIARYLQNDFECVFAMSSVSDWVISQLKEHNFSVIGLPFQEQYFPDDQRSEEPWVCDVADILRPSDVMILDGYRFDSSFHQATKHIGSKIIRIIDDLERPADCDAVITQLPIAHSVVQEKLGVNTVWTGLNGFLIRPEFYHCSGLATAPVYDFLIYVTNKYSLDFYKHLENLMSKKVFAITSSNIRLDRVNWTFESKLSSGELTCIMSQCADAILPASSIAIEYLIVTQRRPRVFPIAQNQQYGLELFYARNLWASLDMTEDTLHRAKIGPFSTPGAALIRWTKNFSR